MKKHLRNTMMEHDGSLPVIYSLTHTYVLSFYSIKFHLRASFLDACSFDSAQRARQKGNWNEISNGFHSSSFALLARSVCSIVLNIFSMTRTLIEYFCKNLQQKSHSKWSMAHCVLTLKYSWNDRNKLVVFSCFIVQLFFGSIFYARRIKQSTSSKCINRCWGWIRNRNKKRGKNKENASDTTFKFTYTVDKRQ